MVNARMSSILCCLSFMTCCTVAVTAELPPAPRDTPEGELHNVTARVGYGFKNPYAFAELEPGPFTVPKGYVATKLIYRWGDSKTDRKNDRITATTIFSVTRGGYVAEAKNNPDVVLPAGDYKLVCGGMAGASGVLTYRLIREDLVKNSDDVVKSTPTKTPGVKPATDDLSKTHEPIGPGGDELLLNLPKDFDLIHDKEPFQEHPWVFRFRGEKVSMKNYFEQSYPLDGGGKSVYTYQTEITGTFHRGVLRGTYAYYGTGGHFGQGPDDSVGLYYKAWITGIVMAEADCDTTTKGLLKVTIDGNRHKHLDRKVPRDEKSSWGPWRDNTAMMEDPTQVAAPWKPAKMVVVLKLPVGELQTSQKFVPEEKVPPIPRME